MKKCQKCGAEYEEDKKFCKRCGSPLLEVDKNSEQNDQDGFQDWKEDNEEAGDEQQSGKKKKKNLWMGILIGLVLVMFCGGIFAVYVIQEKRLEAVQEEHEKREKEIEEERKAEEKAREKEEQKEEEKKKKEAEEQEQKEKELKEQLQQKEEELKKVQEQAESEANLSSNSSSQMSAQEWWDSRLASTEAADKQLAAEASAGDSVERQMSIAQGRYELWDNLLNELWAELEAVLPGAELGNLTDEQVSWIQQKEAMIANYWQGTTIDHSSFPNGPAADMTKERVYYLRGKLPY